MDHLAIDDSKDYPIRLLYAYINSQGELPPLQAYGITGGVAVGDRFEDAVKQVKKAAKISPMDIVFVRTGKASWLDVTRKKSNIYASRVLTSDNKSFLFRILRGGTRKISQSSVDFENFHKSTFVSLRLSGTGSILEDEVPVDFACVLGTPGLVGSYFKPAAGDYGLDIPEHTRVRQDVVELFHDSLKDDKFNVLYLAQPGTGKTVAGLQVLFHFVKAGRRVVYHKQNTSESTFFLFEDGEFQDELPYAEAQQYLTDRSVVYIEDGAKIRNPAMVYAQTLLITSPDEEVYKAFLKFRRGTRTYYGTLWSKDELEECRKVAYPHVSEADCLERIRKVGCVARLVYHDEHFDDAWKRIQSALEQANPHKVLKHVTKYDTGQKFSHKYLLLERGAKVNEGFMVISSATVMEYLGLKCEEKWWTDVLLKYKGLEGSTVYASFRGIALEIMVHNLYPRMLTAVKRLCTDKDHVCHSSGMRLARFNDSHTIYYSNLDDLLGQLVELQAQGLVKRVYCRPRKKTEAAIDSLVVDLEEKKFYLLQVTVSCLHGTKLHPVNKLIFALSDLGLEVQGLYYVLGDNYGDFKMQKWRTMKKSSDGLSYEECTQPVKHICQFKIMFDSQQLLLPGVISSVLKNATLRTLSDETVQGPIPMQEEDVQGPIPMQEEDAAPEVAAEDIAGEDVPTPKTAKLVGRIEVDFEDDEADDEDLIQEAEENVDGAEGNKGGGDIEVYVANIKKFRSKPQAMITFMVTSGGTSRYLSLATLQKEFPEVAKTYQEIGYQDLDVPLTTAKKRKRG